MDFFFALFGFVIGYAYDDRWRSISGVKRRLIRLHPMIIVGRLIDPSTGLYNRRHFQDYMASLQPPADDTVGALFLLDVDHFKHVNDTYGHAAGHGQK
ncbi:diguanylate cyclase domain-containing protein [Duganella radicis]|uniref:diguanylate cyclase domain-containing protein n=1 Tax=Duganella radicis TaxID=551988 RepID=UPI00353111BC